MKKKVQKVQDSQDKCHFFFFIYEDYGIQRNDSM